jgi:uncharacterized protein YecE (DUF72 family)
MHTWGKWGRGVTPAILFSYYLNCGCDWPVYCIRKMMRHTGIFIGTSGWSNKNWTEFYMPKLKTADFLHYYSQFYNSVEINSSFYHLPRATTISGWMEKVPASFRFCPKLSRYITHMCKLKEAEEGMQKYMNAFMPMKARLGPILIQLPPSLKFDHDLAESFFELVQNKYADFEFALEARHNSWYEADSTRLMSTYRIANVISESGGRFPYSELVTAQNIYLRFHGPKQLYGSPYSDDAIGKYAEKIKRWQQEGKIIWVFFNNTIHHDALNNSKTLKRMLGLL